MCICVDAVMPDCETLRGHDSRAHCIVYQMHLLFSIGEIAPPVHAWRWMQCHALQHQWTTSLKSGRTMLECPQACFVPRCGGTEG